MTPTVAVGDPAVAVLVPAVMGVGLLLSLATLVRDEVGRLRSHSARTRRVHAHAHAAALAALDGTRAARRDVSPWRGRAQTTGASVLLLAFAAYLVPGATWNFFNPVNLMRGIAWLWALSLSVVVVAAAAGITLAVAALRWDDPPAAARPLLVRSALTAAPLGPAQPPAGAGTRVRALAAASLGALLAFGALSAFVALGDPLAVDEPLLRAVERVEDLERLRWLNPLAETETAFAVSAVIGVATWRCPPFALTFVLSLLAAWALAMGTSRLVDRTRPGSLLHELASFPSGHATVAALMTGLLPLAVLVFTHRAWVARAAAAVLGVGLVGVVVERVTSGAHWPLDLLASLLIGVVMTAAAYAVVLDPARHRSCRRCPWRRPGDAAAERGAP